MRGKMDYRTKRNIIIAVIVIALFVIASVSTYVYLRGNSETEAVSELNSMTENVNASQQQAGEAENGEQASNEPATTEEVATTEEGADNVSEEVTTTEEIAETEETNTPEEVASVDTTNDNVPATQTQNNQMQPITTTELVEETVTETNTLVGFTPADVNLGLSQLTADLPVDTIAPEYKKLGITNITHYYEEGSDITVAGTGDQIRVLVLFEEELATEPKVDILDAEGNVLKTVNCDFSQQTTDSVKMYSYLGNFTIDEEMNLPEGEIQFVVYGYADAAGNEGARLDNSNLNYDPYLKVVYDKTAPEYKAMGIFNWTNENIDHEDVSVATANEHIRLFVAFPEMLAVNPKVDIYGEDGTVTTMDLAYSEGAQFYFVEFDTIEDLKLPQGKIQYKIYGYADAAGNVGRDLTDEDTTDTRYPEVVYDTTAPEITVKDGYVGNKDKNVYSNVSFKLHDNYGVKAYKINDGEWTELTVDTWSDANFQNIKDRLVYGKNTITLKDVAGNETTYEFVYDNVAPTITVKDGYVGNLDKNVFSNVSFKLYDEYEVIAYKINDGEYGEFSVNTWSDANFENIKDRLVYGKNTITLKDVAGNETTYEFVYDNVAPTITVKDGYVGNLDKNVFSNVSFKLYDEYEVIAYKINDGEYGEFTANQWSDANFQNIKDRLVYGKNTITLKDVAGNETTYEFTYDNIAPAYTNLGIARNKDEGDTRDQSYAKEGDSVRVLISFAEKLEVEPTVKFAGKEYTATYRPDSSNPESNSYYYMADIPMTADMPEGEMQFEVYGYADKAGNVGETLDNSDITDTRYPKVIYDMTAPYSGTKDAAHPLYILNVSDANRRQWIRDGEMLRVEANFNEDLDTSKNPILTIGTDSNVQTAEFEYKDTVDGKRRYVADIVIDNNILKLTDGTQIPFTVTNAFDKAGNEAVLNNEDVTFTSEYGQVTYDNTAPKYNALGIVNATHYDSKEGDIHYAKTDDEIRILVQFDEKLSVEPRIRILGENNEVVKDLNCGWASQTSANLNTNAYTGQFKITDDMNLPEGEIRFEIYGYADAAGNVGEVLDNDDLKYEGEPAIDDGVIYDKTAPECKLLGILNVSHFKDGDVTVAGTGDTVRVYVTFNEKLATEPKVRILGEDGKVIKEVECPYSDLTSASNPNTYLADFTITDDMNLPEGEIKFEVYGYADAAGNIGTTLTNKEINYEAYPRVVYDKTAPVYTNLGIVRNIDEGDTRDKSYAKEGDSVRVLISFAEKLEVEPTVKFAGKEYTATYRPDSSNPESNSYYYMADIPMTADMPEGEMQFEVYGYADKAGNVGETLDNSDITDTRYPKVIYDMTAPYSGTKDAAHPLYILNVSDANRRQWIRDGEMLRVEANFNEDLDTSKNPILTIGTDSNVQTAEFEYKDTVDGKRRYVADIVIDNNILKLTDGTQIPFTVTNAFDKAGNEAVLNNEDVTFTSEYGQVTYDNTAPKYNALGIVNATHYDSKEGDIHYAKTDDEIRILVQFDEKLSVEPRIRILGENNEVVKDLNCGWASQTSANLNTNAYTGQFKITDDMNLPEGEIRFEIYGYADAAGNIGTTLTNKEINYEAYPRVVYDKTAPEIEVTKLNDDGYVEVLNAPINVSDTNPFTVDILDKDGKVLIADSESGGPDPAYDNMCYSSFGIGWLGEGTFTVRATDLAGNVVEKTFTVDVTDSEENTTEETTTETATTSLEGTVTTSNNTVTLKTNKPVEKVEGWTKVDDTTLTKTYSESGNYSVDIEDEIGNEATIKFSVDADKEVETEQEAETESTTNTENTVKTESTTNTESTVETESTTNANVVE